MLIEVKNLTKSFGGVMALNSLSFKVETNKVTAIIGPNGSGKTTCFNVITGFYTPDKGQVLFKDEDLTGWPTHKMNKVGFARTFQNIRLFYRMTVRQNVMTGFHSRTRAGYLASILRLKSMREEERQTEIMAREILEFLDLTNESDMIVNNLPYGKQRKVEIARALASNPEVLLLDEPVAGMNETESSVVMEVIEKLKEKGLTILLVEHDMRVVMGISDKIIVLDQGQKIMEGTSEEVKTNPRVIEAYLGMGGQSC